jgi:hypothetical protein
MSKKVSTEDFVCRARLVHGDKYDYSKVEYKRWDVKVCIVCKKCGHEFWQRPNDHLCGKGCPFCAGKIKITFDEFVRRSVEKHGTKYDYSKVAFKTIKDKVIIGCPVHGWFEQKVEAHMNGKGCKICANEQSSLNKRLSNETFIARVKERWGEKFDLSQLKYVDSKTKVLIGCSKHGFFYTSPTQLLRGIFPCRKCWMESIGKYGMVTYNDFVARSNAVHNNKYTYPDTDFKSVKDKVRIVCPKHGEFTQEVFSHMIGVGCPKCNSSKGEIKVESFLKKNDIEYISQYKITNDNLICTNNKFWVDFFLPKNNVIIEYNGMQHYKKMGVFGGKKKLEKTQDRDLSLRVYCKEHNIKLIEIPYTEYNNIEEILSKKLKIKNNSL